MKAHGALHRFLAAALSGLPLLAGRSPDQQHLHLGAISEWTFSLLLICISGVAQESVFNKPSSDSDAHKSASTPGLELLQPGM